MTKTPRRAYYKVFIVIILSLFCLPYLCLAQDDTADEKGATSHSASFLAQDEYIPDELIVIIDPQPNNFDAVFGELCNRKQPLGQWVGRGVLDSIYEQIESVTQITPFPIDAKTRSILPTDEINADAAFRFDQAQKIAYKEHLLKLQKNYPQRAARVLQKEENENASFRYTYLIKVKDMAALPALKESLEKLPYVHVSFNRKFKLFPFDPAPINQEENKEYLAQGDIGYSDDGLGSGHGSGNPQDNVYYQSSGNVDHSGAYEDLYGIHLIQCPGAWDFSDPVTLGQGVVVAVIDTGVDYLHPDINDNIWINADETPGNNTDDDNNGYVDDVRGWDFNLNGDNDPMDSAIAPPSSAGHGTHCAGIIAAENNNIGIIGVAPKAKIMPLRVFPAGDNLRCAQAVYYAVNNGADVLSCSWGGLGILYKDDVLRQAIDYAYAQGCVIVTAAGNFGQNGWPYADVGNFYPANYHKTIAVAATNWNDAKANFSNLGELIDVSAPGENILSLRAAGTDMGYQPGITVALSNCVPAGNPNAQYYISSGTSMACPYVSGVAALLVAKINATNDTASPWFGLTNNEIRERIKRTADNIYNQNANVAYAKHHDLGAGRLNAARALQDPFNWTQAQPITLKMTDMADTASAAEQVFPGIQDGAAAWGDYDNDGYLDLVITGLTKEVDAYGAISYSSILTIYHNKGRNAQGEVTLEPSGIQFHSTGDANSSLVTGLYHSSVAWGDYNRDGFLDLVVTGEDGGGYFSAIYRNNGVSAVNPAVNPASMPTGNCLGFTNIEADIPDIAYGTVLWIDYDNDGDLDLFLTGKTQYSVIDIYRNDGADTFVAAQAIDLNQIGQSNGHGLHHSSAAAGDYDQDGDEDIIVIGRRPNGANTEAYTRRTVLLENNSGINFIAHGSSQTGFEDVAEGSVAWGDYDNDGDLDLLLTGDNGAGNVSPCIATVYRNDGAGNFQSLGEDCFNLPSDLANSYGLRYSDAQWGDYDNDGDLDVLLTGEHRIAGDRLTRVYFNNLIDPHEANNYFTHDTQTVLPSLRYSRALWVDYDKDNDLDILVFGEEVTTSLPVTRAYRNNAWEYDRANIDKNSVPLSPTGLTQEYVYTSNGLMDLVLSWDAAQDLDTLQRFKTTPSLGISYNVVIGTHPSNCATKSPMAYAHPWWLDVSSGVLVVVPGNYSDGFMRLVRLGPEDYVVNSYGKITCTIKGLEPDYYFWGVQAVDTALAGSPFAYYAPPPSPGGPVQIIKGKVWDANANTGIQGIKVKSSCGTFSLTDSSGNYAVVVPQGWSGTVSAEYFNVYTGQGWYALPTQPVQYYYGAPQYPNGVVSNLIGQDFVVDLRIKGRVIDAVTGQGRSGIKVVADNLQNSYFLVNLMPIYSAISVAGGDYNIGVPFGTRTNVRLAQIPTNYYVAIYSPIPDYYPEHYLFSTLTKRDFSLKGVSISGYAYGVTGWAPGNGWPPPANATYVPQPNVTIQAQTSSLGITICGPFSASAVTDVNGHYELTVPYGWHGTDTAPAYYEAHPIQTSANQWSANTITYTKAEDAQKLQNFCRQGPHTDPPITPEKFNTIQGKVWHDLDAQGDIDSTEPAVVGEKVQIVPTTGMLLPSYTAITDANGNYQASNVVDGTYIVKHQCGGINLSTAGFMHSYPSSYNGQAIAQYQVTVSGGQIVSAKDFGIYKYGSISGKVWRDQNGNGIIDGEGGLGGETVQISGPNGYSATATTSSTSGTYGNYSFVNLMPGTYTISHTANTALSQVHTYPNTNNPAQWQVVVTSNANETNKNFGVKQTS